MSHGIINEILNLYNTHQFARIRLHPPPPSPLPGPPDVLRTAAPLFSKLLSKLVPSPESDGTTPMPAASSSTKSASSSSSSASPGVRGGISSSPLLGSPSSSLTLGAEYRSGGWREKVGKVREVSERDSGVAPSESGSVLKVCEESSGSRFGRVGSGAVGEEKMKAKKAHVRRRKVISTDQKSVVKKAKERMR